MPRRQIGAAGPQISTAEGCYLNCYLKRASAEDFLGAAMQNICLAATSFGLGTCIEDQGVLYPEVIREFAEIPDSKRIVISIAIGYPDPEFPANQLKSNRESSENLTKWIGL